MNTHERQTLLDLHQELRRQRRKTRWLRRAVVALSAALAAMSILTAW